MDLSSESWSVFINSHLIYNLCSKIKKNDLQNLPCYIILSYIWIGSHVSSHLKLPQKPQHRTSFADSSGSVHCSTSWVVLPVR